MKGVKYMKVLKIENKKGLYSTDGSNYNVITDISKEDIYSILDIIYNTTDYDMDEYNESVEIANDVERIIYSNLYSQFETFITNKETLISEIDNELKEIKEKYEIDKVE